ncbi:hypothetical protein [Streptomyces nanshensis]|uniref:hypothetical protein n=1 Tax=Streptomyces nanshensis TaxID=518642 RepID=UPI001495609E
MSFSDFSVSGRDRTPLRPPRGRGGGCDVLVLDADAGLALLRRPGVRTGPVAYDGESGCVQFLVPEGSAEELPGLLQWLEWGGIELGLTGRAAYDPREAAVWLRPPEPGREADRVDLVRLVSAAATECHRARLRSAARKYRGQPLAFS